MDSGDRPGDERRTHALRGSLELCVLAVLDRQPSYAYEFADRLAEAGLGVVSGNTLAPLIARLHRAGLLHEDVQPSPVGPARKVYSVTDAGRTALTGWVAQWQRGTGEVEEVLRSTGWLPSSHE